MPRLTVERGRQEGRRFERLRKVDHKAEPRDLDVQALEAELRETVRGEVRFDAGSRALYATDGSNYRQVPIGVVIPRDLEDVVHTVGAARAHRAPVLPRGGGTSLAGQCCNVAVVLDFTKYLHGVIEIDAERRLGRVQPGCVLDDLRNAAVKHGLNFGPDPATHDHCTLGGMLGNDSCGSHSLLSAKYGLGLRTADNTHSLHVLTYDGLGLRVGPTSPEELNGIISAGGRRGQIYADLKALRDEYADDIRRCFPKLPRRVSGYNLDELLPENGFNVARALVGTEGTCVTILEATLMLVPDPGARAMLLLGYPDIVAATRHLMMILEHQPTALEGMDRMLFDWVRAKGDEDADIALLPPGGGWLLVEFGGDSKQDAHDQAHRLMERLGKADHPPSMKLYDDPGAEAKIWKVREGGLGSTAWVPGHPDTWEGWEDSAVPPENVSDYLRDFRALLERYDYNTAIYGHFGQGCIHCRIPFDLYTTPGIEKYRRFLDDASDLVVRYGGSLSGEHGDGQSKAALLPKMFGDRIVRAFGEFKRIWDPGNRMNPGKVVDPYPPTSNLRLGADYNPPAPKTYFKYPGDRNTFARAALRCVGVGECRREGGGTMCPSYMATREEADSTRGRARLLWEMLNGEVLTEGWRSEAVKDALDLCLACKGCKHDCPVNVDMATYKAEFLAHYYEGRVRPRNAYVFGWIHLWAQAAGTLPALANLVTHLPLVRSVARWAAGMSQERSVPAFAGESFRSWFQRRQRSAPVDDTRPPVVLWADTFNNYFHPETAKAAMRVLERAGFRVEVPAQDLCCGRPLYDYGFLGMAERWLRDILDALQPSIEAGIPVVVLEPSCATVFKDELGNLFPNDEDAKRLASQTFLLSDFLKKKAPDFRVPRLSRKALVQVHCHHKSVIGADAENTVLSEMGLDAEQPELGCCGMAGAFGFETGSHYDVSMTCGERNLLPAVARAADDTLIIADGFSCREQISQGTNRVALHLAEVIELAFAGDGSARDGGRPEAGLVRRRRKAARAGNLRLAAVVGGGLVGARLATLLATRRQRR
ncbi:MAG TPA: FAD-binding and (Fe-S)-binding domain-containing protein [Gemmatimonadales bacterium]|nr:FAD-binding and (Fe-S)-binding domain-containing protein [Gemmatimonadales bacterium]